MINWNESNFNLKTCERDLEAFKNLLSDPIREFEEAELQKFFMDHPNLILLMGKFGHNLNPCSYKDELNLFNEFFADFSVSNKKKNTYVFVELEHAKRNSIFNQVSNKGTTRIEWSPVFEHGYSQIINWFYRLDDYSRTNKLEEEFGVKKFDYVGILIVGRKEFIPIGHRGRLDWRNNHIQINLKPIYCYTYDDLCNELEEKFNIMIEELEAQK